MVRNGDRAGDADTVQLIFEGELNFVSRKPPGIRHFAGIDNDFNIQPGHRGLRSVAGRRKYDRDATMRANTPGTGGEPW